MLQMFDVTKYKMLQLSKYYKLLNVRGDRNYKGDRGDRGNGDDIDLNVTNYQILQNCSFTQY